MKILYFILFFLSFSIMSARQIIPTVIQQEVAAAMQYFPQLKDVPIEFKFKKNIKHSTMQAQPSVGSFFRSRKKRNYKIFISEKFKISGKEFKTTDLPSDILIGWIGHELGHIMDYESRNRMNLILFGIKYVLSDNHIIEAERAADTFAVIQGMKEYILKTKDFILNHADITPTYKERIQKYYLSPEEIMHLANENEENEE